VGVLFRFLQELCGIPPLLRRCGHHVFEVVDPLGDLLPNVVQTLLVRVREGCILKLTFNVSEFLVEGNETGGIHCIWVGGQ
jgi:hypothetical protein